MIIEWASIQETDWIPPFGEELKHHILQYRDAAKHASCSAWGLLYKVLQANKLEYSDVRFEDGGKPYFKDSPTYFSVSHSKGMCAVALSDRAVGVDIEQCQETYNTHMVEQSLSKNEKKFYTGDFTKIWCKKEAIAKMTGEGIMGYPKYLNSLKRSYCFQEQLIERAQKKYWIVAVNKKNVE